jgi:hypothetical protein
MSIDLEELEIISGKVLSELEKQSINRRYFGYDSFNINLYNTLLDKLRNLDREEERLKLSGYVAAVRTTMPSISNNGSITDEYRLQERQFANRLQEVRFAREKIKNHLFSLERNCLVPPTPNYPIESEEEEIMKEVYCYGCRTFYRYINGSTKFCKYCGHKLHLSSSKRTKEQNTDIDKIFQQLEDEL